MTRSCVNFDSVPPLGTVLVVDYKRGHSKTYRLVWAEPYLRRRDGQDTFVLHWADDEGSHFTSGLRSNGLNLKRRGHFDVL